MQNLSRSDTDQEAPDSGSEMMMANLRKDIHDWNKGRHENEGIATSAPPVRKRSARAPKLPEATPQAAQAGDGKKQPFRMSYDGISAAEQAASRHSLGAR